jgi:hypothetical protein
MNVKTLLHLQSTLVWIDDLIRAAVARAQSAGHDPTDALRGLVISDEDVAANLSRTAMEGLLPPDDTGFDLPEFPLPDDDGNPLVRLVALFGLNSLDCYILMLTLAPELDRRYERLYGYLQDDVSQRRPTVNLMMNLLGGSVPERFAVWERLAPTLPLRAHSIIECLPDPGQHHPIFLAHHLKVDHRILAYLLGEETPDQRLKTAIWNEKPGAQSLPDTVRHAFPESPMIYMHGTKGAGRGPAAAALCAEYGLPLLRADLVQLGKLEIPFALAWKLALREARLSNAAILFEGWESCLDDELQPPADFWSALQRFERPVFLSGAEMWEPHNSDRTRLLLRVAMGIPEYDARRQAWEATLESQSITIDERSLDELVTKFKLTPEQISNAVHTAVDLAFSRGESVRATDLYAGAQAHTSMKLGRLARRVIPRYRWDDLILPPDRLEQLQEICARVRYAHTVNQRWGYIRRVAASPGVTVLFAGESGTGKTLAAEVIANDLGLALYKIDLSTVVSKYIGETEKNLSLVFNAAEASNAVLFFDEADALFGKRSEVKDAHDRYANLEVAYLLQQLEAYEGIAILATNLRQNLDEAFTRRLSFMVDFPFPEKEYRQHIWASHFPAEAPLGSDVSLTELADRYPLAGGNIRNAALAAAYLAAADGGTITMAHIRNAIRREHQKMGRLLDDTN